MKVFCLLLCLTCIIAAVYSAKTDFFVWNDAKGNGVVVLPGGQVKTLEVLWAGFAAWNDPASVANAIRTAIRAGKVPYINSYMFGDNGIRTNLQIAASFDEKIAQAIGTNLAFVNLETELDVDAILSTMKSPQGLNVMKMRIQKYRQLAPNAVLTSSPGLWKPASEYSFFKPIAQLLDVKGDLYHAASDSPACTRLANGGDNRFGMTWAWANNVQGRLDEHVTKMRTAWGDPVIPFMTADTAITSCGWGAQGQSTIIKSFVDRMDCLYKKGWRGTVMRNKGPEDVNERAFGVQNEGLFTYSTNPASVTQVQAGLNTAIRIMKTGARC